MRSESFSYIGREGHGTLHIALSVLVLGLSIGLISGPSGNSYATTTAPVAIVDDIHLQTAPALVAPPELILASIVLPEPEKAQPNPEKKRNLKVRNGDTLMSIMLSAGIARDDAHNAVSALRAVYEASNW